MEVVADYFNDFESNHMALEDFMKALECNRFEGILDTLKRGNKNDA